MAIGRVGVAAVPARVSLRARVGNLLDREEWLGPAFVSPALVLLLILVAYPFCMALYFSVSNAFIGRPSSFVGLRNFINLWDSDAFRQTFQNSFVFAGSAVALKLVLGITLALLLNEQLWFKRLHRGAVLLPWVIPTALSTLGWWWMFNSLYSVVNWTGLALGIMDPPGPNWLGQKYYAMTAVVIVNIWRGLPFFAITILAGLVAIPKELYEAAEADGAGPIARFWYVTLPLLKGVLAIVVLFSTIFTFSEFNIVYVLTHGGPMNSTHLFATLARQVGLETGRIGEGAAISLYLFPALMIVLRVSWPPVIGTAAASALARLKFFAVASLGTLIFVTSLVPTSLLFLPLAQVVNWLGLGDSKWALVVTSPTFLVPFCTWLLMGYFRTVPKEVEECAMVDGATRIQALLRIVLPIAVPG